MSYEIIVHPKVAKSIKEFLSEEKLSFYWF